MARRSAAQRKAMFAKLNRGKRKLRPKGKLVIHKQKKTWYLQNATTGVMEGRDDDSQHPKGTIGRKDDTKVYQDERGIVWGRKPE